MLIIYALTFDRNNSSSPGSPERATLTTDSASAATFSETEISAAPAAGDNVTPTSSIAVRSDGSKIVFASHRSGSLKIYISDSDGSNTRQLTKDETLDETGPAWSPDGQRIAFYAYGNDGFADIYLINADGSGRQNLTNSPDENDRYVSWSPDGQYLLFHSDRPGSDGSTDFELYSYSLDDGTIQQLTFNKVADLGGDWSPDGQKIAFHSYEGGVAYIYTMNIDGTNRQRLSPEDIGGAFFPTWSPDGKAIAFHVNEGEFFQIYVMDSLDGGNLHPLMDEVFNDQFPDWSPSGDFVIFQREKETNVRGEMRLIMGIYHYNLIDNTVRLISSNLGDFLPDWQPVSQ
jgi:Tol biopolymer transport system component